MINTCSFGQSPGKDGAKTVTGTEILNRYANLASDASAGSPTVTVTNIATLLPLTAGDLLMMYQAQGATIFGGVNSSDPTYGSVGAYNNSGNYEFVGVQSIAGNTITLTANLKQSYTAAGRVQVIRVPQYSSLTIAAGGVLTTPAWDGQQGGVVAVFVQNSTTLDGTINASGLGFRGGVWHNGAGTNYAGPLRTTTHRSTNADSAAEKGESIAGPASALPAGRRYGRGAPANGGGGGNNHNGGGGGGSNGNNGNLWTGHGVMNAHAAWALDPYRSSNSSGGGRGGYSFSSNDLNALTAGPGAAGWGGNYREVAGGLGGHPLTNDACSRVFFGGGGGAGDANNNSGGSGGSGGGIVILLSYRVTGTGMISANGSPGADTNNEGRDAPGGGGGGGTILVNSSSLGVITINANGGAGGKQLIAGKGYGNEAEGPGGGGGGGFIATSGGTAIQTANGGNSGTSDSPAVTEFPPNGATAGAAGQTGQSIAGGCLPLPVELVSFSARVANNAVQLRWKTATEKNNYGFEIERSSEGNSWETINFVPGHGTSNIPWNYDYSDVLPAASFASGSLYYRLKQIDRDGTSEYSPTLSVALHATSAGINMMLYPNPTTGPTNITFSIPVDQRISVTLHDMLGQEMIRLLDNELMTAGIHVSSLRRSDLAPGTYMVRITGEQQTKVERLKVHR